MWLGVCRRSSKSHTREPRVKEYSHSLIVVVGCNINSSVSRQVDVIVELADWEVGRKSDAEPELGRAGGRSLGPELPKAVVGAV